jgi:hypothetical protein
LGAVCALVASCSPAPKVEERPVFVYSPRACPVSQDQAYSVVYAGGDFEPSLARPPIASVYLRDLGRTMDDLPQATRSVVVDIAQSDSDWRGVTYVPSTGPINVLVWPNKSSCELTRDLERRDDLSLGVFGHHFMVTGGRSGDEVVPNTYVGDLTTGAIERLAFGPSTRRSHATITPFGAPAEPDGPSAALIAGGEDPDSRISILSTAEVYVPKIGAPSDVGDFERQRIDLSEGRTEHGAVVLATGETLLVGGRGPAGPLRTMEVVDPATQHARTAGVALLRVPRSKPTVLRLASGEILVAGGVDALSNQVPTLEWFSADASHATKRPIDLVTGRDRAFVPLEAGGALAVIIPEDGATDFKSVWVISADGTVEPALSLDPSTLDAVRLFTGAEGAPLLWTGKRWLRWAPWFGTFQPIDDAPQSGPALDAIASADPGLALWLDDRGATGLKAIGYRFAVRTRYDAVPKPLLVQGPDQLAPDRLAGFPGSSIHFDPNSGLYLGPGASAFVTDVTFEDFDLDVDVAGSTAGTSVTAATVVLREENGSELEVGGAGCAFGGVPSTLTLRRRDRHVDVSVNGGAPRTCPTVLDTGTRVAVGLRGAVGAALSGARNLRINRR